MTIAPGTRLGSDETLRKIGAGGMGEVYKAKDPKLGREVAIKVLPPGFAEEADRLRRFEQDAPGSWERSVSSSSMTEAEVPKP